MDNLSEIPYNPRSRQVIEHLPKGVPKDLCPQCYLLGEICLLEEEARVWKCEYNHTLGGRKHGRYR